MHIILGGTSGLGWELTQQLRARGDRAFVVGLGYDEEKHGEGFSLDLYDAGAVNWIAGELDRVIESDVLQSFIWTAGYGWTGDFIDQPDARSMVDVNFAGPLPLIQWAWRKMLVQEITGQLVIVSSSRGVEPRSYEAVYVATKFAQVGLARSLALEVQEKSENAQILLCLPGGMRTPFWEGREPDYVATLNDPVKVAARILQAMSEQVVPFVEISIPRGTLV